MIPETVKTFLLTQKQGTGFFCLALNKSHHIVQCYGEPKLLGLKTPNINTPIFELLPILITESFAVDFEIPFYNISEKFVCNICFLKQKSCNYLVLIDRSEIFQVTQKYQQFAHDDNITKNKFKRLAQQLEKTQQKLKKSNQEKATLIAMLSHELGTPLTSILGYSELMLNNATDPEKGLEIIHRNANYLQQLIENTLMFGKTEAGGQQIQLENVSIKSLFKDLASSLLPAAQNKNLKLIIPDEFAEDNTLNIDLTRTKQILINLLNNAIKYTEAGAVELQFFRDEKHYTFSIIDTGLGVSKDLQKTIFNPWERIKENTEQGSGIGLFISRKLAHAIGGKIKLISSSKEKGSVFQLTLPVKEMPSNDIFISTAEYEKAQNKSILIIDDDYDILVLIEALLQSSGLRIFTATDYPKACHVLSHEDIDIVLTDYNLGTVTASSFITELNNAHHNLPVLLMSAMPSDTIKASYLQLGFKDVISKPLNRKALIKTLFSYL
ncbi:MAG: hybrid sensor histidine kinase/response regulator [Proteobacteria bacterium]|nr:hybrid sensor histidine kinase/response regulator [Pseudomonadota bacterium]